MRWMWDSPGKGPYSFPRIAMRRCRESPTGGESAWVSGSAPPARPGVRMLQRAPPSGAVSKRSSRRVASCCASSHVPLSTIPTGSRSVFRFSMTRGVPSMLRTVVTPLPRNRSRLTVSRRARADRAKPRHLAAASHPTLSVSSGLVTFARRAGIQEARSATPARKAPTLAMVPTSAALTPKSQLSRNRPSASAAAVPTATPRAAWAAPRRAVARAG